MQELIKNLDESLRFIFKFAKKQTLIIVVKSYITIGITIVLRVSASRINGKFESLSDI